MSNVIAAPDMLAAAAADGTPKTAALPSSDSNARSTATSETMFSSPSPLVRSRFLTR